MSFSNDDHKKKKKNHPFDTLSDKELKRIFEEMKDFIESDAFRELVEDIIDKSMYGKKSNIRSCNSFDENIFDAVSDISSHEDDFSDEASLLEKPTADIMKDENHVMVTIHLPAVLKEDITLHGSESDIEIIIDSSGKRFYDVIDLPALVDPTTARSTYINGILDIVIKRKHCWDSGIQIHIS